MTYEFDPEDAHKAQKALFKVIISGRDAVESPLRRVSLPEMPAGVRGQVISQINEAIATMADARVGVAGIAMDLKHKATALGVHDKIAGLPWWVHAGDAGMAVGSFFGVDAIHKTVSGDYSKGEVAEAWLNFGLNFVPPAKVAKVAIKGGKGGVKGIGKLGEKVVSKVKKPPKGFKPKPVTPHKPPIPTAATPPLGRPIKPSITHPHPVSPVRPKPIPTHPPKPPLPSAHVPKPPVKPSAGSSSVLDGAAGAGKGPLDVQAGAIHLADGNAASIANAAKFDDLTHGGTWLHTGGNSQLAASMASQAGGMTIEQTAEGAVLNGAKLFDHYPPHVAIKYWNALSARLIAESTGPVNAVAGASVDRLSTFARVEIPGMLKNTKIPSLSVFRGRVPVTMTVAIRRSDPEAAAKMTAIINKNPNASIQFNFVP